MEQITMNNKRNFDVLTSNFLWTVVTALLLSRNLRANERGIIPALEVIPSMEPRKQLARAQKTFSKAYSRFTMHIPGKKNINLFVQMLANEGAIEAAFLMPFFKGLEDFELGCQCLDKALNKAKPQEKEVLRRALENLMFKGQSQLSRAFLAVENPSGAPLNVPHKGFRTLIAAFCYGYAAQFYAVRSKAIYLAQRSTVFDKSLKLEKEFFWEIFNTPMIAQYPGKTAREQAFNALKELSQRVPVLKESFMLKEERTAQIQAMRQCLDAIEQLGEKL